MTNHEEPTDAELANLLSTYANALYENSVVPDGETAQQSAANDHAFIASPPAEPVIDLNPHSGGEEGSNRGRILMLVAGFFLAAAIGAGAVSLLASNDSSEVDVAQDAETDQAEEIEEVTQVDEDAAAVDTTESVDDGAATSSSGDVQATSGWINGGFNYESTVFVDGDFASVQAAEGGFEATFGIGDDSNIVPTVGIPVDAGFIQHLIPTESGFAMIVESFGPDEVDFGDVDFGPGPEPERYLATSTDLVNWTTTQLPTFGSEGDYAWISTLAASGDQILLAGLIENSFSPEQILVENGVISEEDAFNICSSEYGSNESGQDEFVLYTCDLENYDEFSSEPPEETELIRIQTGDELFPLIEEAFDFEEPEAFMVVGAVDGEFEVVDAPVSGWNIQVVGTPSGFVAIAAGDAGTQAARSTNGFTWTEVTGPDAVDSFGISSLSAGGETILAIVSEQDGMGSWVSNDLGSTWTESPIGTQLFNAWGQALAGPAGFVVEIQGATEPFEGAFDDFEDLMIEADGYTMSMSFSSGQATLIGPDGLVIHDGVLLTGNVVENVVRFDGVDGENLVWLDPETGEELVTFTEEDADAAYEEAFDDSDVGLEGDYTEPDLTTETWFSADGLNWTLLRSVKTESGSFSGVLAVGDDDVLTFSESYAEPPEELFNFEIEGREPSDEEIEALDAWYAEGSNRTFELIPIN